MARKPVKHRKKRNHHKKPSISKKLSKKRISRKQKKEVEEEDPNVTCGFCELVTGSKIDYVTHLAECETRKEVLRREIRDKKYKSELRRFGLNMTSRVVLRSSDGVDTESSLKVLYIQSAEVRKQINSSMPITHLLFGFPAVIIEKIRTYCVYATDNEIESEVVVDELDADFKTSLFHGGDASLFQLGCAADLLKIHVLLGWCVRELSLRVIGKSNEEIKEMFGLTDDLSDGQSMLMAKIFH